MRAYTKYRTLPSLQRKGILYVVGTRCGFDLSAEEQDFSQIVKVTDEDTIYRLGSPYAMSPCNVLRAFSKDCRLLRIRKALIFWCRADVSEADKFRWRHWQSAGGYNSEERRIGKENCIW